MGEWVPFLITKASGSHERDQGSMWWWQELTITIPWRAPERQYCTLTVHSVCFLHREAVMMSPVKIIMHDHCHDHDQATEKVFSSHYPTCRWVTLLTRCWKSIFILCVMSCNIMSIHVQKIIHWTLEICDVSCVDGLHIRYSASVV
jgi:hypothetical protein